MLLAADVAYDEDTDTARVAGVLFGRWSAPRPEAEYVVTHHGLAPYQPGSFFMRELPCLLTLLGRVGHPISLVIVDGYVDVASGRPGLGRILYGALSPRIPVVGVAKSKLVGAEAIEVLRGDSTRPLQVSAVGMDPAEAAERVRKMHGRHRLPTLLKRVDQLSRGR